MGRGRKLASLAFALLFGLGLAVSPAGTPVALAADKLRVQGDATYTLDPEHGRVHVAIKFKVTDLKPNSGGFIYYYTGYYFGIHREARNVRASDGAGSLSVTTKAHEFYIEAKVNFRNDLYYQDSATFTVRYDLVAGAPRSASPIRVGRAFATFGVWAWGDHDRSSVEVRTPRGFGNRIDGGPMSTSSSGGQEVLRATPAEPESFYAIVTSENPLAYRSTHLSLGEGIEIVVMAWPEDGAWDDTVSETLRNAVPELLELIGLDWPVEHDLNVRERYTPALEGYAGIFFTESQRIDVSEDLDPVVIVHETSHAWFNQDLFVERWIYEGLAEEYAWRTQNNVGGARGDDPTRPDLDDPGHVALASWRFPEVIRDQKTDDQERYGYQAAFWVVDTIVDAAGLDQMKAAFAAADADLTAYVGAGDPEEVGRVDNWRRLLDLVEPLDEPDSRAVEKALIDFVLHSNDIPDLGDRSEAREEYRDLVEAGDGWLPPWYIRKPMGEWRFGTATPRMDEATAVLELRDQVASAAADLELAPDDALRSAYEGATDGFDGSTAVARRQLEAIAAIADARSKVEAEPDLITRIGLLGEAPRGSYDEARTAFERGELDQSLAAAAAAAAIVAGASSVGGQRLALAVGVAIGVLVLLAILVVAARRRRRRAMALPTATLATATPEPVTPEPVTPKPVAPEPYATLAADPGGAPPPQSERPPDAEGDTG